MATNDEAFQFEDHRSHCVLTFLPPLNDEWSEVQEHAKEILSQVQDASSKRLLLDLGKLEYCGSAVVALMVRVWKKVQERKGTMAVSCPSDVVRQVLATARLTDLWLLHDSREDAERALGVAGGRGPVDASAKRAAAGLFLLAIAGVAGGGAWGSAAGSFAAPQIGMIVGGVVFLLVAGGVWWAVRGFGMLARVWTFVAYTASAIGLGCVLGSGALTGEGPPWRSAVVAVSSLVALGLFWLTWSSLGRSQQGAGLGTGALPGGAGLAPHHGAAAPSAGSARPGAEPAELESGS